MIRVSTLCMCVKGGVLVVLECGKEMCVWEVGVIGVGRCRCGWMGGGG